MYYESVSALRGIRESCFSDEALRRFAFSRPADGRVSKLKNPLQTGAGVLKNLWIPLVIAVVLAVGGSMIWQFHGVFGSHQQGGAATRSDNIVATIPKFVSYEVIGPRGATGTISYIDEFTRSQDARFVGLPWTHTFATTAPGAFATLVVQGDSDSLGCRITVNGVVRDEVSVHGRDVMAYCLVKAA